MIKPIGRLVALSVASAAVALLAACSANASPEPTSPATPSQSETATPSASATPTVMSRARAGKYYLKIVKPFNKAIAKCGKAAQPLHDGEWYGPDRELMAKVRKACKGAPKANKTFIAKLEAGAWPKDAQADIDALITESRAWQLGLEQIAKARTPEEYYEGNDNIPKDTNAADLVRARLGLSKRADTHGEP